MKLWILLDNQYTVDVWKGVVSPSRYSKHFVTCKTQGKIQSHFGMTLDYPAIGKVQIMMSDYIKRILESLPPSMDGESVAQQQITCS